MKIRILSSKQFQNSSNTIIMKSTLYITIAFIFIWGCKSTPKTTTTSLYTITPLEQATMANEFSRYIDSLEVVRLEVTPESFITHIKKILLSKNKEIIVLNSTGILVFDHNGKFIRKIGNRGRGPEEYMALRDICLSNDYQYLLALDYTNQIITYNLQDGKFIKRTIPEMDNLDERYLDFVEICPSGNNGFFLFCCNPPNISDFRQDFYCLIEFDKEGRFINKYLQRIDFIFPTHIITQSYKNEYIIRPLQGDNICYKIVDNKPEPFVTIDFKDKYIPQYYVHPKPGEGFPIQEYMHTNYYKLPIYIHNTSEYFYFGCCAPKAQETYFIFSLKEHKGLRWQSDPNEEDVFLFKAADSTFFYGVYNDYKDYSHQEQQMMKNTLKKYILEKTNISLINGEQNPAIIKIKFKI